MCEENILMEKVCGIKGFEGKQCGHKSVRGKILMRKICDCKRVEKVQKKVCEGFCL